MNPLSQLYQFYRGEYPQFSLLWTAATIITTKKNWSRYVEHIFHALQGNVYWSAGYLSGNNSIHEKGKIQLAVNKHKIIKIGSVCGKAAFGKLLLVPVRNIAEKDVFRNQEIAKVYSETLHEWVEKVGKIDPAAKDTSALAEGVCLSMCLSIAKKVLKSDLYSEKALIQLVRAYRKGAPSKVAVNQLFYSVDFPNVAAKWEEEAEKLKLLLQYADNQSLIDILIDKLRGKFKEIQEIGSAMQYSKDAEGMTDENRKKLFYQRFDELEMTLDRRFAQIYDLKFDDCAKVKEIGSSYLYKNSFKHLENFASLLPSKSENQPAVYLITFGVGMGIPFVPIKIGGHAILYIKLNESEGFFLDPNFGLIKCEPHTLHNQTLLKILALYPPVNFSNNYRVIIAKLSLI